MSAHASQDFVTTYNVAVKLDATTARSNQGSSSQMRPSGKQKFTQISSGLQQQAVQRRVDHQPSSGDGKAVCSKCGLTHAGSCNATDKTCYNCGKSGHLVRVCRSAKNPNVIRPKRLAPGGGGGQSSAEGQPQARSKAFATTSKAAEDASTVVTVLYPFMATLLILCSILARRILLYHYHLFVKPDLE